MRREEHIDESQGGQRLRAHPQVRRHLLGQLLSHQPREQCPRRGRRAHLDDGRGALRRRGGRRLLARHLREADRRVHGDGEPERGGHPDGLRRHRPGLGGLLSDPHHRGRRGPRREPPHPLRHRRGLPLGDEMGGQGRSRRPHSRLRASRLHASPLLYVGEGVLYADATSELKRFAELAQMPVLTTLEAKGAFPENHELSVGVRGSLAEHFLTKADVLFSVGAGSFTNNISHSIPAADKKTIIQCTVDTLDINRSYETRHAVIGDAKLTLQALIDELGAKGGGGKKPALVEEIRKGKQAFMDKFRPWLESSETPINPYRVFGDLMKVLDPQKSFLTADSGNTRDQTSTVYEAQIPRGYLGWGNVSTLGFSLAGAIGAKLAYPDRQCVHVTGDAGVCYMMGNFEAVARYKIGIMTIHINNGGYSGYGPGFWGAGHDPYTYQVSPHDSACMANMAKALGFHAEDVTQPAEIIPALRRALDENAKGRPAFLEFICSHHPVHGGWVRPAAGGGH